MSGGSATETVRDDPPNLISIFHQVSTSTGYSGINVEGSEIYPSLLLLYVTCVYYMCVLHGRTTVLPVPPCTVLPFILQGTRVCARVVHTTHTLTNSAFLRFPFLAHHQRRVVALDSFYHCPLPVRFPNFHFQWLGTVMQ